MWFEDWWNILEKIPYGRQPIIPCHSTDTSSGGHSCNQRAKKPFFTAAIVTRQVLPMGLMKALFQSDSVRLCMPAHRRNRTFSVIKLFKPLFTCDFTSLWLLWKRTFECSRHAPDNLWQIFLAKCSHWFVFLILKKRALCIKKSQMLWLNWKSLHIFCCVNNFFPQIWKAHCINICTHIILCLSPPTPHPQHPIISQTAWIALVRLSAAVGFLITLSACLKHLLAACIPPVFAIGRGGWMSDPAHHHIGNWTE